MEINYHYLLSFLMNDFKHIRRGTFFSLGFFYKSKLYNNSEVEAGKKTGTK